MKLDEEGLRRVFNTPALRAGRTLRGCPEALDFQAAIQGTSRRAERDRFADHLVACQDCAEEYRIALSLVRWSDEAGRVDRAAPNPGAIENAPRPRPAPFRLPAWSLAIAATVLVAIGVVLAWRSGSLAPASTGVERGKPSLPLATDPPDQAVLSQPPESLRWPAVEGAQSYRVAIYDSESTLLWKSEWVAVTETRLPAAVRERLAPGRAYLWRSFARVGIDERVSEVSEFVLSPAHS